MKKYIQIITLLLIVGLGASAQLANWSPGSVPAYTNFPTYLGGQINGYCRITQFKFHVTNPNKMYAVTAQGGFFTSTDGGNNWTVKAGTENYTGKNASICIDYTNDQIIYMGTGDPDYYENGDGIFKSTDGGASFSPTTLTDCLVLYIIQNPANASTFVAATNKGIYKSTDNGATWNVTTSTSIEFCDLKQNAALNSQTLYACTKENTSRFFRSIDFGSSWTEITSGIDATSVTYIQSGGRIGVTPADPNVVYFAPITGLGMMNKSTDGGLNFILKKDEGIQNLTGYDSIIANGPGQGNYNNSITVDRVDPTKLWYVSHCMWSSSNSGATWTFLHLWADVIHTDAKQITQSPFNSSQLWASNDGGIYLSTDGGVTWSTKSNGLYAYEIANDAGKSSHTNRDNCIIGTQDNGKIYRSATEWTTIGGGDDYEKKEYDYQPNGGNIYNFKGTRSPATSPSETNLGIPGTGDFEAAGFNRSNIELGFIGKNGNIYLSTNLSAGLPAWTQIATFGAVVKSIHSCIADVNRLYVITDDDNLHVSTNATGGSPTFTNITLPSSSNSIASIAAIANNATTVYISINDKVYVSINGGANWTDITYNLPSVNHRRILAEEIGGVSELVFIATNNAVFYKKAGQVTWTNYSTNLPGRRSPTDFSMYDDGTSRSMIRYASFGRGLWESPFNNLRALQSSFDISQHLYCTTGSPITYADNSTGTITSWSWSFPGGTPATSTSPNPIVTYSSPGLYSATLTVGDGTNTSTFSRNNFLLLMASAPTVNTGCTIAPNSNSGNNAGLGISSFALQNIANPSSGNDGVYHDYTCLQWTTLLQGGTYSATITTSNTNDEGAKVFADWNDNGIFEASEAIITYPSNTAGTRTLSFTVPSSGVILNKGLRLRVVSQFSGIPADACDVSTYGQAEDYTVYVFAPNIITASAGPNGSVSPTGAVSVPSGANQTFTITANNCFQRATVLVDGVNNPAAVTAGTYTFNNVTANHTISATFSAVNLDDNNACTTDACDPSTGTITHTPVNTNDNNPCTTDACDPITGVSHTNVANGTVCGTGDACSTSYTCQAGVCTPGNPINTNDNNACTTDGCDPVNGIYHNPVNTNDNNVCTTDACDPATGVSHTPINTNDNNACTTDACDPATGVSHTQVNTNDNNACTTDGCNPSTGVFHNPVNTNDNNACTIDACDPVTGVSHTPVNINDGIACTKDACNPTTGVSHIDTCGTCTHTPGMPGAISGLTKACPGDVKTYSITAVSGATSYLWTAPTGATVTGGQGTTSATITFGAGFTVSSKIKVAAINACGTGSERTKTISRNTPAEPSEITGNLYGNCNLSGMPYSVVNVPGVTYNWSFNPGTVTVASGQGTNAITANFSAAFTTAQIKVSATNGCGTSAVRTRNLYSTPAQPSAITGSRSVYAYQSGVPYSTPSSPSVTSYEWVAPTGSHINDGFATSSGSSLVTTANAVTVNFGSTGGQVKVRAKNACGYGSYKKLNVSIVCSTSKVSRDGVSSSANQLNLNCYPSPASTELNVTFVSEKEQRNTIRITDVVGKTVLLQTNSSGIGENLFTLDLSKLSSGIYIIEVVNGDQNGIQQIVVE